MGIQASLSPKYYGQGPTGWAPGLKSPSGSTPDLGIQWKVKSVCMYSLNPLPCPCTVYWKVPSTIYDLAFVADMYWTVHSAVAKTGLVLTISKMWKAVIHRLTVRIYLGIIFRYVEGVVFSVLYSITCSGSTDYNMKYIHPHDITYTCIYGIVFYYMIIIIMFSAHLHISSISIHSWHLPNS